MLARLSAVIALAILPALTIASVAAAHQSGCHAAHSCPSDHHSYVWFDAAGQGHDCAKPGAPEYNASSDTEAITFDGLPYYCHPVGSAFAPPVVAAPAPVAAAPPAPPAAQVSPPTATCTLRSVPDPFCTPGARTSATAREVCRPGYARRHRQVNEIVKRQVYATYGVTTRRPGEYQVDHLVSLELGGDNSAENLWPQTRRAPGYRQKDRLENRLHALVCSGRMTLARAQRLERANWLSAYRALMGA